MSVVHVYTKLKMRIIPRPETGNATLNAI